MFKHRGAGTLLHPTSLPGQYGIGTLGAEALRFIDFLAESGQHYWQICPLGPTGFGDSPYQCFSAFAGNPLLIDLEELGRLGLIEFTALESRPAFPAQKVDFGPVIEWKSAILEQVCERFPAAASLQLKKEFEDFQTRSRDWLPDFTLFMALKQQHGGAAFPAWDKPLRKRQPAALKKAAAALEREIERHAIKQFFFFRQWRALREYARQQSIRIIGDAPIFVAHDSADAWAHQHLFFLDAESNPTVIAGVPPDYFSKTGQRWGNPLFRWDAMAKDDFRWWLSRLKHLLQTVDVARLDHFRGFEAYWEVPAGARTAETGKWVKAPGKQFFATVQRELGDLPFIAEDLGVITPEVEALRDDLGLPGMKILQFAFGGGADNPFLPHNYISPNCVVYTGTHDNDTSLGWYQSAPPEIQDHCRRYLWIDGNNVTWDLIHHALLSIADTAIIPLQDWLGLGPEARMNFPGHSNGNWTWRFEWSQLHPGLPAAIREQLTLCNRLIKDRAPEKSNRR